MDKNESKTQEPAERQPADKLEARYGKIGSAAVRAASMLAGKFRPASNRQEKPVQIVRERQS